MALTVKDILALPALKAFSLIAGEKGLERDIITAGIVDYEFVEGIDYNLDNAFEKDSLVISSLLFAKDNPDLILPAVKQLIDAGVSAFAYKSIIYDRLPDEVISYAENNNFPIFSYKEGTWFENIIFEVMAAVESDDTRHLSQLNIEKLIRNTATQGEIESIRRGISLLLNRSVSAAYIKNPSLDAARAFRSFYMSKNLREKMIVAKYDGGLFVLITTGIETPAAHRVILDEACQILSLPVSADDVTLSRIHPASQLHKAFQDAYFGWLAGLISHKKTRNYENFGVYAALLPLATTSELRSFSENYMEKIKGYEETVEAYVNNGGDINAAAVDLHCHANTIRYRLNKMKELLNAKEETDHELFRDLSIAYAVSSVLSKNY